MLSFTVPPMLGGGAVYLRTVFGHVAAYRRSDGRRLWGTCMQERKVRGPVTGIAVAANTLIVSTALGRLAEFNLRTGKPLWDRPEEMILGMVS